MWKPDSYCYIYQISKEKAFSPIKSKQMLTTPRLGKLVDVSNVPYEKHILSIYVNGKDEIIDKKIKKF